MSRLIDRWLHTSHAVLGYDREISNIKEKSQFQFRACRNKMWYMFLTKSPPPSGLWRHQKIWYNKVNRNMNNNWMNVIKTGLLFWIKNVLKILSINTPVYTVYRKEYAVTELVVIIFQVYANVRFVCVCVQHRFFIRIPRLNILWNPLRQISLFVISLYMLRQDGCYYHSINAMTLDWFSMLRLGDSSQNFDSKIFKDFFCLM